jgi:hypothetical protein
MRVKRKRRTRRRIKIKHDLILICVLIYRGLDKYEFICQDFFIIIYLFGRKVF